ncbi:MAG TPA: metallophosphoesterase family protein [Cytophagaceae bacterium]
MTRIGLISDTHGFLDTKVFQYFEDCDEIWHAGDIGSIEVADQLAKFKPLRGVYGNIDGAEIRNQYPEHNKFQLEGLSIWITHIGGYPGHYNPKIKKELSLNPPNIFVCGHSHILKVMTDKTLKNMLCLNPGAAGKHGFHHVKTILKFDLNSGKVENMQAIELGKRASLES